MKINNLNTSRKAKKRLVIESIALFLIIAAPFFFKSHDYLSKDPDATLEFLGFTIDRNGFANLRTYAWFLLGKIIPLYLLVIWFFTCKHWWYHILLIPICMYAFQIFEVVYSEDQYVDTDNIMWLLPVCMVVIPFVYFVRVKLYDKYVHGIDLEAMDVELQYYRDKENNELKKHGIVPPSSFSDHLQEEEEKAETDLSERLPQSVLAKFLNHLKHSFQSIF